MDPYFSTAEEVEANRNNLYRRLSLRASDVVCMAAKQGDEIVNVTEREPQSPRSELTLACDGLITERLGQGLLQCGGDCIPMVIYSPNEPIVGLIHVGIRGAQLGIHTQAIQRFVDLGVPLEELAFRFEPCIKQASYVYDDLPEIIAGDDWEPHRDLKEDGYHLDLLGYTKSGVLNMGVEERQISASSHDTGSDEREYFSHCRSIRKNEPNGRNATLVVMRERKRIL